MTGSLRLSHTNARFVKHAVYKQTRRNASSKASTKYLAVTHPEDDLSVSSTVKDKLARFNRYTLNTYSRPPLLVTHAKGSWIYTSSPNATSAQHEGVPPSPLSTAEPERKYLDFTGGIAVNSLGHADDELASLMKEQASKILHQSNLLHNEWAGQLAELLVTLTAREGGLGWTPGSSLPHDASSNRGGAKVFFSNSGTEANEGALKFARKVGKDRWAAANPVLTAEAGLKASPKTGIVCFENGFHGRSMGALSVTTNPKYQDPFYPLIPNVRVGKMNDVSGLETLIDENTCGIIVEPIQGEGGIRGCDETFLRALRKRADDVGAVLIFDEIQCGLYRTGSLWAHSNLPADCHPDMVTMAKPLANGYPIGAILVKDGLAEAVTIGLHGTTFGGSALATRLGHNVLSRLSSPSFVTHIKEVSTHLRSRLSLLPVYFPHLIQPEVRGQGLIIGIPFKDHENPGKLVKLARERGLLVLTAGNDAVRLLPSLNVSREEADLAVDVLESSLSLL